MLRKNIRSLFEYYFERVRLEINATAAAIVAVIVGVVAASAADSSSSAAAAVVLAAVAGVVFLLWLRMMSIKQMKRIISILLNNEH